MKSKFNKIVIMMLLVFGMSLSLFLIDSKAADTENVSKIDACEKQMQAVTVAEARKHLDGGTYPTLEGFLFGGWYTQSEVPEDVEQAEKLVIHNDNDLANVKGESVYALFVPKHVLDVKAQVSTHLTDGVADNKDNKASIRFVTTVDSVLYKTIGFEVSYKGPGGKVIHANSSKSIVYEKLYLTGVDDEIWEETPWSSFCGVSKYFTTFTIKNIPSKYYQTEFTVKPYWVTLSGDKVYGDAETKKIEDGYKTTIIIKNSGKGTVTTEKESYRLGDTVVVLADAGYYFTEIKVDGKFITLNGIMNTYQFTAKESNYIIEVKLGINPNEDIGSLEDGNDTAEFPDGWENL